MNIYGLTTEIQNLEERLFESLNEETGEVDKMIIEELAVKEEEFNAKALSVADLYRSLEARDKVIEDEIARLQEMREKIDKVQNRLKENLSVACITLNKTKIEGIHSNISFRLSEQTIIDDEDLIPEDFKKAKITVTVDKTKIKNCIKAGAEIPGAHVVQKMNIQIK